MSLFSDRLKTLRFMNWPLVLVALALMGISLAFIYSSCFISEDTPVRPLYQKQAMWIVAGIVTFVAFALMDYGKLDNVAAAAYIAALVLLVVVLFIGVKIYGARRWLALPGNMLFQPSELAKVSVILLLAHMLSRPSGGFDEWGPVSVLLAVVAVPMVLIMKEPDLGTALVLLPVLFAMMFAGGVSLRILGTLAAVGVMVAGLGLGLLFLPEKLGMSDQSQRRVMKVFGLSEYHKDRIRVFVGLDNDPLGRGWNKIQSKMAVGSGGVTGKGYLKGTQNILNYLPPSVAPTDFIYAVIAEESGFIGSVVVLSLFGVLIGAGMATAMIARDRFGRLLCVGIVTLMFVHVCINMAMTVGLMPIVGLPLPLLSYGGSFMLVMMSLLGVIQSVHIRSRHAVSDIV